MPETGGAGRPRSLERGVRRRQAAADGGHHGGLGSRGRRGGHRGPGESPAHPEFDGADGEAGEGWRRRQFGADGGGRAGEEEDDGVDP